uniref:Wzy n=1 Tax=Acinetobacter baumannii TaxID=470 RepID=V5RCQ8_ACIBA|nr:Wzy [Acinetobacter baumannii]
MNGLVVKKRNFFFFFITIGILYLSIVVANRDPNVDRDYYTYLDYYSYGNPKVEPVFKLASEIFHHFNNGFIWLLGFFAFFGLLLKIRAFYVISYKKSFVTFFYMIFLYLVVFFPIWEMTQIRMGLAISLLVYAFIIVDKLWIKTLFCLMALLCHYGTSIVIALYFIIYFFSNRKWLLFSLSGLVIYIFSQLISRSNYEVYNIDTYVEVFNPYSFKNFYIFLSSIVVIVVCYFDGKSDSVNVKIAFISLMLLVLYFIIGATYPSMAIRYADISLFFCFLSLGSVYGSFYATVYKMVSFLVLIPYFFNIYFLSSPAIVNINFIRVLFNV